MCLYVYKVNNVALYKLFYMINYIFNDDNNINSTNKYKQHTNIILNTNAI